MRRMRITSPEQQHCGVYGCYHRGCSPKPAGVTDLSAMVENVGHGVDKFTLGEHAIPLAFFRMTVDLVRINTSHFHPKN